MNSTALRPDCIFSDLTNIFWTWCRFDPQSHVCVLHLPNDQSFSYSGDIRHLLVLKHDLVFKARNASLCYHQCSQCMAFCIISVPSISLASLKINVEAVIKNWVSKKKIVWAMLEPVGSNLFQFFFRTSMEPIYFTGKNLWTLQWHSLEDWIIYLW